MADHDAESDADADVLSWARYNASQLSEQGILTDQQALVYVLTKYAGLSRTEIADAMDTTANNVDNLWDRAVTNMDKARTTVAFRDVLEQGETLVPDACASCGGDVPPFTIVDGEALCPDCEPDGDDE